MRRDFHVEINHRDEAEHGADEVNHVEREVLGYDAACSDADTNADVPRREVGAGGRCALVVGREVDVKGVHGREDNTETNAEQQRDGEEHCFGCGHAVRCYEAAHAKDEKCQHHWVKADVDALRDVALVNLLSGYEARGSHSGCHQCEEEARRYVEVDFACVHGYEVGRRPIRYGEH